MTPSSATLERPPAPVDVVRRRGRLATFRGQWRVALRLGRRDAWRAKGRSLLVLLIVGLPVAVVTFSLVAATASQKANLPLGQLLGALPPQADARLWLGAPGVVQSTSGDQSDSGTGTPVELDDVRGAFPDGSRFVPYGAGAGTVILSSGDWALPGYVAIEDVTDPLLADRWSLAAGRLPSGPGEIALSRSEADRLRVAVGGTIDVGGTGTRKDDVVTLAVVGLVRSSTAGTESVVLPSTSLPAPFVPVQAWFVDSPQPLDWQDVRAINVLGGVVGSRAVAENPPEFCGPYVLCLDDGPRPGTDLGSSGPTPEEELERNAALLAAVSVLVVLQVALLAGPAFAVQLRRRQRELGLVGASGGDSAQLTRTVLASGLVLGVVASTAGLLVGWAVVGLLGRPGPLHAIGPSGYDLGIPPFPPYVLLVALVGVVAAVSAAVVPAVAAGRGDVVDALRGRRPLPAIRSRRPLLGLVIGLLGLGVMAYGVTRLDSLVLVVGIVTAELGVVLVMPWLVVRTAAVAGRLPLGPRIAVRDAGRHRMRTTAAACAIAAAAAAAVGTTAAAGSLSYGYQYSDVPVAPGVVAVTDEGYAYGETDGQARPSDHIAAVLAAVDRADPDARATVLRPVSGAAGYDPATGAGWVSCGDDPASVSYSDGQTPTPCQGRGYRLSGANVVLIEPADVDLALGPAAPLDDVRAALARGDAVVLEPNAVTDGRVQLWVAGPMDMDGLPTSSTAVDVPAVEVLLGAVPAQVLVGPAFLERGEVKGVLVSAPNGGVVLSAPSAPDTADRPTFEDRVGVELVRDEVPAYVYNPPQFTDDAVVVAAIAAGATMLMALLAGLMVTALALADGRADVGTLAAVGAPPRVRRRMAASSAGYVSLLGCVVGALSGLVAGRLLLPLAQPDTTWRTPWLVLVLIVVVVPLLTAGTAWVTTRSKVEMVRRLDS